MNNDLPNEAVELKRLNERLTALTEEKNALLDYIEEKENTNAPVNDKAELASENKQLKSLVDQLQKTLSGNLMRTAGETFGSLENTNA